jgi:hypothetical protein
MKSIVRVLYLCGLIIVGTAAYVAGERADELADTVLWECLALASTLTVFWGLTELAIRLWPREQLGVALAVVAGAALPAPALVGVQYIAGGHPPALVALVVAQWVAVVYAANVAAVFMAVRARWGQISARRTQPSLGSRVQRLGHVLTTLSILLLFAQPCVLAAPSFLPRPWGERLIWLLLVGPAISASAAAVTLVRDSQWETRVNVNACGCYLLVWTGLYALAAPPSVALLVHIGVACGAIIFFALLSETGSPGAGVRLLLTGPSRLEEGQVGWIVRVSLRVASYVFFVGAVIGLGLFLRAIYYGYL